MQPGPKDDNEIAAAVVQLILGRRSIRGGFTQRPIPDGVIEQIVACGLAAPSSKNAQPWRIHVVTSVSTLGVFADAVRDANNGGRYAPIDPATGKQRRWQSTVAESAEILRNVPLALFVENLGEFSGGRRTVAKADDDVRLSALVGYGLEMGGIGAAIQNMWLAARAHGVEGVFMGDVGVAEETITRALGLRGDLVGVLALGFTATPPTPKTMSEDRLVRHEPV